MTYPGPKDTLASLGLDARGAGYHERTPANHAADLATEASRLIWVKYQRGQQEHGGQLWRKTGIIDMAIEEAVDQVIYLLTLRDQIAAAGVSLGDLSE